MITIPVVRTIQVEVIPYNEQYFVRTREIANLLEIKQPFEFNADIKKHNPTYILKGEDTLDIRTENDLPNVTFIELNNLLDFFEKTTRLTHRINNTVYEQLVVYLKKVRELGTLI